MRIGAPFWANVKMLFVFLPEESSKCLSVHLYILIQISPWRYSFSYMLITTKYISGQKLTEEFLCLNLKKLH